MKNKKTMHELAKEFPEKTYRELEKYRDADRQEEAQRIFTQQENEELKEDQHKDRTIFSGLQFEEERKKFQDYKEIYKKEQARSAYLQDELDRVKRENNDLHNKVSALLDAVDPERKIQKARESGL